MKELVALWLQYMLVPVYKDGDVEMIRNYSGITQGGCVAKVITSMEVRKVL